MDKEDVIHTYSGMLLSAPPQKKSEIVTLTATWMDLESRSEKEKYIMISLIWGI